MKKRIIDFLLIVLLGTLAFALSFVWKEADALLKIIGVLLWALATAYLIYPQKKEEPVNPEYRYAVKPSIMSAPELELYDILLGVVGSRGIVYPQMALISLLDKTTQSSYRNELFRIVDFAVCDRRTFKPLLVIELNDASHKRAERAMRDEKVRCILERAQLPLVTLTLDDLEDERAIRKKVLSAL